jgi:hypothetical protein
MRDVVISAYPDVERTGEILGKMHDDYLAAGLLELTPKNNPTSR